MEKPDLRIKYHDPPAGTPHRRIRLVLISLAALVVTAWAVISLQLYQESLRHARDATGAAARLLAERTQRMMEGTDILLRDVQDTWRREGPQAFAGQEGWQRLKQVAAFLPLKAELVLIDGDGVVSAATYRYPVPRVDLSDRSYFRMHRGGQEWAMGPIIRGRLGGQYIVTLSRRLAGPGGSFAGVVMAAVNITAFQDILGEFPLGQDAILSLLAADGTVFLRLPVYERLIGAKFPVDPKIIAASPPGTSGTMEYRSPIDNVARIVSYHPVPATPYLAFAGSARADALREWWSALYRSSALALAMLVAIILFGTATLRSLDREERGKRDLVAAHAQMERRVAERTAELAAAKEDAERLSAAKTTFLATMSHELRTPLNAIIGFSEALQGGIVGALAPRQNEYIGMILQSARLLLRIINDILDFSDAEAAGLELFETEIDVRRMCESCVSMMNTQLLADRVTLSLELVDGLADLYGDELRLKQALLNLLSNAIKFTARGSVVLAARPDAEGGMVIEVRDTGIGMAEKEVARALEPFSQLDTRLGRRYEGSGLGLSLARKLVALHGGHLSITSGEGVGTTVRIHLPASRMIQRWETELSPI